MFSSDLIFSRSRLHAAPPITDFNDRVRVHAPNTLTTHIIAIVEPIEQKHSINYTTIIFNKMSPDAIFATSATSLYPSAAPVTQKIHHHHRRALSSCDESYALFKLCSMGSETEGFNCSTSVASYMKCALNQCTASNDDRLRRIAE